MHMHTPQRLANINLISTSGCGQVHPQKLCWLRWPIVGKIIFLVQRSVRVPREKSGKVYVIWQLPNKMLPPPLPLCWLWKGTTFLKEQSGRKGGQAGTPHQSPWWWKYSQTWPRTAKVPCACQVGIMKASSVQTCWLLFSKFSECLLIARLGLKKHKGEFSPKEFMSWRRDKACTYNFS